MQQQLKRIKCVLLGKSYVGKTSVAMRLNGQGFSQSEATVSTAYFQKQMKIDNIDVQIDIWDTAGQERYAVMAPVYYRDAQMIVIVYDVTEEESFQKVQQLVDSVKFSSSESSQKFFMILGNKCDLDANRQVQFERGKQFADNNSFLFFETSCKNNTNVDESITALVKIVLQQATVVKQTAKLENDECKIAGQKVEEIFKERQTNSKNKCC